MRARVGRSGQVFLWPGRAQRLVDRCRWLAAIGWDHVLAPPSGGLEIEVQANGRISHRKAAAQVT
jgi:hypothetical protein